jgi:CTP synthase (UTP-ammonia lyase)
MADAEFEETTPTSPALFITRLVCSLAGVQQCVKIVPNTQAFKIYGKTETSEKFTCNYGLNESYRSDINRGGLWVTGHDSDGNTRIIELFYHPFFMATLFLPQLSSTPGNPHQVIMAFLETAMAFRTSKGVKNSGVHVSSDCFRSPRARH